MINIANADYVKVGRLKSFSRLDSCFFKRNLVKQMMAQLGLMNFMLHTFHNLSIYTVIGSTPRIERTCYPSLLYLLLSVTVVSVNLNINNLGEDGDVSGLVQEQEHQAKSGHLGSLSVPAHLRPPASYFLLCSSISLSSKGRKLSLPLNRIRFKGISPTRRLLESLLYSNPSSTTY